MRVILKSHIVYLSKHVHFKLLFKSVVFRLSHFYISCNQHLVAI